jgi:hypothetical protein
MRVAPHVVRSATLGVAFLLAAGGAHAQSITTRQIDTDLVETTVTRTPTGTVITRRPLAPAVNGVAAVPAPETYVDETVGAAPAPRTTTRHATTRRTVTVRTTTRRAAAAPLVLAPAQRRIIYRTLVQEEVVPAVPSVPGYPPFPAPAAPGAGYVVATPADTVDEKVYAAPVTYRVGTVLPASVAVEPLPARAAIEVPAARPYSYATVDGRVLLVDPATDTVVADITP